MRKKAPKGPLPLAPAPAPMLPPEEIVYPEIEVEPPHVSESGIFDDLEDDATQMMMVASPPLDDIPPLDTGLTLDEKQEFIRLLNLHLPPEKRAAQLAKLAMFTDQKRAAVGLRALQEIFMLTGMNKDRATESTPMFVLPADTRVSVTVQKVSK